MNPNLTSAVSEIPKGRTERSNKRVQLWLGKLVSFAFARFLMIFIVGFAAGIAWQSYGGTARKAIAGWSPHLGWLAPAAAPGGTTSPERLKATTLALAAARQSLDKLANEISSWKPRAGMCRGEGQDVKSREVRAGVRSPTR